MPELLLVKVVASAAMVLALTAVAEHLSPRLAGILSGYPLGAAIALFFIGVENGARFAADSAVYTLAGFSASLVLVAVYHWVSATVLRGGTLIASSMSVAAFLLAAAALSYVSFGLVSGSLLTVGAMLLSLWRFNRIDNLSAPKRVKSTASVLLVRAMAAALIVLLVTGLAGIVGERWAGVLSAFPITLFPFMVIIHLTYGKAYVHTIIKNFPLGMGSLIVYAIAVAVAYPRYGVAVGTAIAFLLATGYLLLFSVAVSRFRSV